MADRADSPLHLHRGRNACVLGVRHDPTRAGAATRVLFQTEAPPAGKPGGAIENVLDGEQNE